MADRCTRPVGHPAECPDMAEVPVLLAVQAALVLQVLPEERAVLAPPIRAGRSDLAVAARSGQEAAVIFRVAGDLAAALAEVDPVAAVADLSPR